MNIVRDGSGTALSGGRFNWYNTALTNGNMFQLNASNGLDLWNYASSTWSKRFTFSSSGDLTANSFVKLGGTGSQFLMADGTTTTGSGGGAWGSITGTLSSQTDLQNALDLKAPLASPTLTGTPTAPTATAGTNTTQIATTAFVYANSASSSIKQLNTIRLESYGDSFTTGMGASSPSTLGYVALLANLYSLSSTNRAVSSTGMFSTATLHNLNINPTSNVFSSVMVGFNDIGQGGNDAKTIAKIKNGIRAIISNQFLDRYYSASSGSSFITKSGTWSAYTASSFGGKTAGNSSVNSGNYIEYAFTDTNVVVAMIGSDGSTAYGTFDVTIDGVSQGSYTLNNQTDGLISAVKCPFVLYYANLTNTAHTIRITQTNSSLINVDYFGNLKMPKFCNPLLLFEIPKRNAAGYASLPITLTDSDVDLYNTFINDVVSEFSGEYPVYIAKTNDYYSTISGVSVDNVHPNDIGHRQIFNSAYDILKTLPISAFAKDNLFTGSNTFTGLNNFQNKIMSTGGIQIQGDFPTTPTGAGLEINYSSSIVGLQAYNRTGSAWLNMYINSANTSFYTSGTERMRLNSSGRLLLGTTTDDGVNKLQVSGDVSVSGIIKAGAQIRLKSYTVATLPTGTQGDTAYVTDALTPAYLVTVVGGGAVVTPVFYNGTNWVAH